jgi:hypothetical protein
MRVIYSILIGMMLLIFAAPLFGQDTTNCFLTDFETKYIYAPPPFHDEVKTGDNATVTVTINAGDTLGKVSKYIYGNNANTWMSKLIDQPTLLNNITLLSPNIIRFPGGSSSDVFFWDALTNQPPPGAPDSLVNDVGAKVSKETAGYRYGKNPNTWTCTVDDYYSMLETTMQTGMITINYGFARYGTGQDPVADAAHYAAEWVRYDDGRTKYWEIGNENHGPWEWGWRIDTSKNKDHQPQTISGELYGRHFLVFADSMRKAAEERQAEIYIGAQLLGVDSRSSWNPPERTWNAGVYQQAGDAPDFYIIHSYYTAYNENTPAATILDSAVAGTVNMMRYLKGNTASSGVRMKPIALTEWNIQALGSKKICSYINGMSAAITLGELAKNGYGMAARWDLANGYSNGDDHGMFNQGDEPTNAPKWNPRPAFFYMYYFQKCFGDHIVRTSVTGSSNILAYSSRFASGHEGIVIANKGTTAQVVKLVPEDYGYGDRYYVYSLVGGTDNGDFSQGVYVNDNAPSYQTGGPINVLEEIEALAFSTADEIKFTSPGRSVQYIMLEPGEHTGVNADRSNQIADRFTLDQNYPNPFNPLTTISYSIPQTETVSLKVYDALGREIATLVNNEVKTAGTYNTRFDGVSLSSGIYFYRLQAGSHAMTKKMALIK